VWGFFPPAPPLDWIAMAEGERDSTGEWILSAEARPVTLAQLEQRIDHALAVARSSEAAALEIGAAAIEAAEQARRAAEMAERASAGAARSAAVAVESPTAAEEANGGAGLERAELELEEFDSLWEFTQRADRVAARLRAMAPVV
jgi:hypothetical protein